MRVPYPRAKCADLNRRPGASRKLDFERSQPCLHFDGTRVQWAGTGQEHKLAPLSRLVFILRTSKQSMPYPFLELSTNVGGGTTGLVGHVKGGAALTPGLSGGDGGRKTMQKSLASRR